MTEPAAAGALIDAAEHHFAIDGFAQTSLRSVMRHAGTDPGAVHYHFGGREALAAAVLDRILVPLNDQRLQRLTALESSANGGAIGLAPLLDALVRPDLEMARSLERRGEGRAQLVGRIYLDPAAFVIERVQQRFGPVAARFHPHLIAAVPDVPAELLGWRIRWCVFGTLGSILADPHESQADPMEEVADRLVATLAGAIAAPTGRSHHP